MPRYDLNFQQIRKFERIIWRPRPARLDRLHCFATSLFGDDLHRISVPSKCRNRMVRPDLWFCAQYAPFRSAGFTLILPHSFVLQRQSISSMTCWADWNRVSDGADCSRHPFPGSYCTSLRAATDGGGDQKSGLAILVHLWRLSYSPFVRYTDFRGFPVETSTHSTTSALQNIGINVDATRLGGTRRSSRSTRFQNCGSPIAMVRSADAWTFLLTNRSAR